MCVLCSLILRFERFFCWGGVALIHAYSTVKREIESGDMSFFEMDLFSEDRISTQLIDHKNKWFSPLLREFTNLIEHEMSRTATS